MAYTARSGDTLSAIARRYNTTVAALLAANPKLKSDPKYKGGNTIFSGTKINLPGDSGGGSSTQEVFINDTRPATPPVTQPTVSAPPVNPATVAPSVLASGESGAIGAASIAAQLAAIERAKQAATQQAAAASAEAAEKARVQALMASEEAAIEAARKAEYEKLLKMGFTVEQASSQTNYNSNAQPVITSTTTDTPTTVYPKVDGGIIDKLDTPSTTSTTTTPTDYTGQIAKRGEENGKVVYRLPDGTIVDEVPGDDYNFIYYRLPNGTVVKSGKLATAKVISTGTETPSVKYYTNPTTGEQILGPDGKPIVLGPGGSATDVFSYTEALRAATEAKQRAALANTFSRRQAQTELEKSQRTTGRDIYSQQQKALNELAKRGITSAPGLQTAARRAAGAVPLAKRLDALQQYQQSLTATDLMLAGEQAKADETQRQALVKLTQASNIANKLSGGA